jgi:hypothetical protein
MIYDVYTRVIPVEISEKNLCVTPYMIRGLVVPEARVPPGASPPVVTF